ncbi:phage replisome organizer N-terminal domain-containing protein [Oenococcus sicerae]|uniref:phage replisome organizer N-terminal domain-containing protein n=1 Tax=Oenococcus sicerae TaxID=2203724 RepID=UPI0039EC280D
MAEIHWIKLKTTMFDDEKIRLIQSMPESDSILVIWIRLLVLAGKTNDDGLIYIQRNMPYSDEMLATLFNKQVNIIRLAITTLSKFDMIDVGQDGTIAITNWEKHQNIDGLEKIREQSRIRMQKSREKKKQKVGFLPINNQDRNVTQPVTSRYAIDTDTDTDTDTDINPMSGKPDDPHQSLTEREVIQAFNQITGKHLSETASGNKSLIKPRLKGHTLEDFQRVFKNAVRAWQGSPKMERYIQLSTLMQKAKFDERIDHMAEAFDKPIKKETLINYNEDPPKVSLDDIDPDLRELL